MQKKKQKIINPWPMVKIIGHGTTAKIFIDGHKVNGLLGYEIKQNAQDKRIAEITLKVQCNLDLEITAVPVLPEPWATIIKNKNGEIDIQRVKFICP